MTSPAPAFRPAAARPAATFPGFPCRLLPLLALLAAAPGCGFLFGDPPDKVNIELRKEKQTLQTRVAELEQKEKADQQVIGAMRSDRPTVPTLPHDRLAKLWTTHGLQFGRLTGGLDRDPRSPGDEGVKVYVAPTDGENQPIKMAGAFTVEAFDLADPGSPLVGRWAFDVEAAKRAWRGSFLDYTYVLECPWQQRVPRNAELTLKVQFVDELTQATFEGQQVIKVKLPSATQPAATQPATTQQGEAETTTRPATVGR